MTIGENGTLAMYTTFDFQALLDGNLFTAYDGSKGELFGLSSGTLEICNQATCWEDANLIYQGCVRVASGLFLLGNVSQTTFYNLTLSGSGELELTGGDAKCSTLTIGSASAGTLDIQSPDSTVTVTNDLVLGSQADVQYTLSSAGASGAGTITVTDDITVNGSLSFDATYTPSVGDTWTLMTFGGGVSGGFAGIDVAAPSSLHWALWCDETNNEVNAMSTYPGDANHNGSVTDGDYTLWADHFGQQTCWYDEGDFNGDGVVTDADYTIWADNFGAGQTAMSSGGESSLLLSVGSAAKLETLTLTTPSMSVTSEDLGGGHCF
jgi:hypothetical protein